MSYVPALTTNLGAAGREVVQDTRRTHWSRA